MLEAGKVLLRGEAIATDLRNCHMIRVNRGGEWSSFVLGCSSFTMHALGQRGWISQGDKYEQIKSLSPKSSLCRHMIASTWAVVTGIDS